ncbi:MAG: DUF4838 domain-containing protein [Ignavibacteria bacterium]|nr:DUF4838 domain-containing protein [Ignavibacteria bacterium]
MISYRILRFCFLLVPLFPMAAQIPVVEGGRVRCSIVLAGDAGETERRAAEVLRAAIERMSGAALPVVTDETPSADCAILIGASALQRKVMPEFDRAALEDDGYRIVTRGQRLLILGGVRKGVLYGVYGLLERLGCRMYSKGVTRYPKTETVVVPAMDVTQVPFFTHREAHFLDAMDRAYSDWHGLHSLEDQEREWGLWVHTFEKLVPPAVHFTAHPEYYTLLGGRRIPSGQLCLTNPAVEKVLVEALRERMRAQPEARVWSVSQNDNINECQCFACAQSRARYGASCGTVLSFVNSVARQFPDRTISTLAYDYTRTAPKGIAPERNVNIMLCSIECNRSRPIDSDPRSASFRDDVTAWSALSRDILVWDYVVQFRNLVSPFPNLRVLQPNIRYFARSGVRKMFQQGCGANIAEFSELRCYLIAKLLWNPEVNIDSVMNDFLDGTYGPAGPHIRRYIDLMHDALAQADAGLNIFGYPYDALHSYLTPELLVEYTRIFDEAEAAAAGLPDELRRVRVARLPLEYAILEISLREVNADLSYFDRSVTPWRVRPAMRARLERFAATAEQAGIERLEEGGTSPREYRASIEQQLRVSVEGNKAYGATVTLKTAHSEKYPVGGGAALTNGLHGPNDYHCNWLGFEGGHMDAVIDLGKATDIRRIATRFLQQWHSWIWLPREVEFLVSMDGEHFERAALVKNTTSDEKPGSFSQAFDAELKGARARYVRVRATSILACPDWHIGAGGKAWIFCDEVVVE